MGIIALNTAATEKYVSTLDSGYNKDGEHSPEATYWELGAMDSYIQSYVSGRSTSYKLKTGVDASKISESDVTDNVDISVDINGMAIDTCRLCLRGWENFKDTAGNDIEFKTRTVIIKDRKYQAVDPDCLSLVPKDVIMELYERINTISSLTEKQVKNSVKG